MEKIGWTLMTSHGVVLFYIAANPRSTVRSIASAVGLTERRVQTVIQDLGRADMITVSKVGNRNVYQVNEDARFRHPTLSHVLLRQVIGSLSVTPADAESVSWEGVMSEKQRERLRGLYVIVDPQVIGGRSEDEVTRAAIAGGARLIQLRDKVRDKGVQLQVARRLKALCAEAGVLFIVNDHVDLALAVDADGVHVGQEDLPVPEVRRLVPSDFIVGCSTKTVEQALAAQADGADYVAVGVFPSPTKPSAQPFEHRLDVLSDIKAAVSVPVCAISGINEGNIDRVLAAGADMVAVISAVVAAANVEVAARALSDRFMAMRQGYTSR